MTALIFCTVIDDAGKKIQVEKPVQRIISLAPDVTETLFAAGAGDRVIGVVSGSDYPTAVKKIPRIGSYSGIDLEKTISLRPDLIVTWGNTFSREINVLKKLGIPVYVSQPRYLQDIPHTLKNLGCLTGTMKQANAAAENFSQQLAHLQQQYRTQKPVSVFYQIGDYSLITINKKSWINQVIEICGGRNIFANAKTIAPEVDLEAVMVANPQVIISDATNQNWKNRWQHWQNITAVKENKLFNINPDLIDRAGPRLLEGAKQMCEDIHSS